MTNYILRRLAYSVVSYLGVIVIVFFLLHLSGDPTALLVPLEATQDDVARIRHAYGLDLPLPVQFVRFLRRLLHGDLGYSFRQGLPVIELLAERAPATLQLASAALLVAILIGVSLGAVAATRPGSAADASAMFLALLGMSVPSFWLGLLFIIIFGVLLGWLPVSGYGSLQHLLMPSIVLGSIQAAQFSRLTRTGLLEVLAQDYIRTARSKGVSNRVVLMRHALRNAALPLLTVLGMDFGRMLGGAVVVETVFAWPGMGLLAVQSVLGRDFPVVQGAVIVGAGVFLSVNFAVDILYGWIDPRLRTSASRT